MQRKLFAFASPLVVLVMAVVAGVVPATVANAATVHHSATQAALAAPVAQNAVTTLVATTAIPSWVPAKCRNANGKNGQVICVGIKSWQLVALQDHKVFVITAARHGAEGTHRASNGDRNLPTRRGTYKIFAKYTDKVSTLYGVHMPYFMPFSGGQGIHYSSEYASGYRYSHGCVGLKSLSKARKLFNWAKVGTTVIVVDA